MTASLSFSRPTHLSSVQKPIHEIPETKTPLCSQVIHFQLVACNIIHFHRTRGTMQGKSPENNDDIETKNLLVVGMNRARLAKIISLVEELQVSEVNDDGLDECLRVKIIPCLASMGSYKGGDGNKIRYMANFVYQDGSAMTQFLDDPSFRTNSDSVLMVGYEWFEGDQEHIRKYLESNQLSRISTRLVQPNHPEFDNLQDEMEAFKNLDQIEKQECLVTCSMGPAKMAKWIFDAITKLKQTRYEEIQAAQKAKEEEALKLAAAELEEQTQVDLEEKISKPQHEPADPNQMRYACKMCRSILFGDNHLAPDHVQNLHTFKRSQGAVMLGRGGATSACQSIFCSEDVLAWLSPGGQDIEGKLVCPKCSYKIGHWKWAGAQCSCGTWVTPAIQIPVSKVDIIPPASSSSNSTTTASAIILPRVMPGVITPVVVKPTPGLR